jgi:predicted ArsR family transcriptional regulator
VLPSEAYRALGSDVRLKILEHLARRDLTSSDLAKSLNLHPVTIRYHLEVLLRDLFVEKLPFRREGVVGRPGIRYRLTAGALGTGFPSPMFEMLSELLLEIVSRRMSREQGEEALRSAGRERGLRFMETVGRNTRVTSWDPIRFADHFVRAALSDVGLEAQVVRVGNESVRYRLFSCPFRELSARFPEQICDHLDVGFHEGLTEGLGPHAVHERIACMGHGAPYCEYVIRWNRRRRKEVP